MFAVQLVAFVLFRYVQTSTDVALTWANPTLICPGYLINLGAPVVPLDKTTNIEEFRRQQEKLEETIAMEEDSKSRNVESVQNNGAFALERCTYSAMQDYARDARRALSCLL